MFAFWATAICSSSISRTQRLSFVPLYPHRFRPRSPFLWVLAYRNSQAWLSCKTADPTSSPSSSGTGVHLMKPSRQVRVHQMKPRRAGCRVPDQPGAFHLMKAGLTPMAGPAAVTHKIQSVPGATDADDARVPSRFRNGRLLSRSSSVATASSEPASCRRLSITGSRSVYSAGHVSFGCSRAVNHNCMARRR